VCLLCSVAIPNCLKCSNYTYCQACFNNSYYLDVNTIIDNRCLPCSTYITGCDTCTNTTACDKCLNVTLYLFNPITLMCVSCDFYLPNCSTCLLNHICLTCFDHRFAVDVYNACTACESLMASCYYCSTRNRCKLCLFGRLLPDRSGCYAAIGCIVVDATTPLPVNCIKCDPAQFIPTPLFNGSCKCIEGWIVGNFCTTVVGCAATKLDVFNRT
jgi:hypothetical protein